MNPIYIFFFLVTAGINAAAQLLLKQGSIAASEIFSRNQNWLVRIVKVFFNPFVFSSVIFLAIGMIIWLKLISRVELSQAYPVNIALTIIFTTAASIFFFQESLNLLKVLGILIIIVGLWLIIKG